MGRFVEPIDDCPAGNIMRFSRYRSILVEDWYLTTSETAHNMKGHEILCLSSCASRCRSHKNA
nr:CIC_HP1_G0046830.mRNA.1.CDS.1 [Saccharomyces cerevisiae]